MGAVSAGIGAIGGIAQMIGGAKEKREAADALARYKRQELTNQAEGLTVSTLGADLEREQQAQLAATQVDALKGAGTRGILGGLGRVEAGSQAVNQRIGAGLDMQQKQIDQEILNEDIRIRQMQEQRENADISALSSQYQSGKNDSAMGMGNLVQSVGYGAQMFGKGANANPASRPNDLTPVGQNLAQGIMPTAPTFQTNIMPQSRFGTQGIGMFNQPQIPQSNY